MFCACIAPQIIFVTINKILWMTKNLPKDMIIINFLQTSELLDDDSYIHNEGTHNSDITVPLAKEIVIFTDQD